MLSGRPCPCSGGYGGSVGWSVGCPGRGSAPRVTGVWLSTGGCPQGWPVGRGVGTVVDMRAWWQDLTDLVLLGRVRRLRETSYGALPGVPCRPERGRTAPGAPGSGAARAAGRARGGPL